MLSFWEEDTLLHSELLIVGAGITGLSTAASYLEKYPGRKITVLERGLIPAGASTRNAGFACFGSLTELVGDTKKLGLDKMLNLVEMRWSGLQILRKRLGDNALSYEENGGYELIFDSNKGYLDELQNINKALVGIFRKSVFALRDDLIPSFGFSPSVRHLVYNPFEANLHPGNMIMALERYVSQKGGKIITGAEVKAVEPNKGGFEAICQATSATGEVRFYADQVAICTNAFTSGLIPHIDITPGRGQVVVTSRIENLPFKGSFHFDEGYYYFRNLCDRVLLGGGRNLDFAGESTNEFGGNQMIIDNLKRKLEEVILPGKSFTIDHQWSGIMAFGAEKWPIVKKISHGLVVGVRLSGMGIALGSLVGRDLVNLLEKD